MTLSKEECKKIRVRCDSSTPGEWRSTTDLSNRHGVYTNEICKGVCTTYKTDGQAALDSDFIAHARQDVPALLDALESVEAERDWLAGHIAKDYFLEQYKLDGVEFPPGNNETNRIWLPTREYWIAAAKAKNANLFLEPGGIDYWRDRTIAANEKAGAE